MFRDTLAISCWKRNASKAQGGPLEQVAKRLPRVAGPNAFPDMSAQSRSPFPDISAPCRTPSKCITRFRGPKPGFPVHIKPCFKDQIEGVSTACQRCSTAGLAAPPTPPTRTPPPLPLPHSPRAAACYPSRPWPSRPGQAVALAAGAPMACGGPESSSAGRCKTVNMRTREAVLTANNGCYEGRRVCGASRPRNRPTRKPPDSRFVVDCIVVVLAIRFVWQASRGVSRPRNRAPAPWIGREARPDPSNSRLAESRRIARQRLAIRDSAIQ